MEHLNYCLWKWLKKSRGEGDPLMLRSRTSNVGGPHVIRVQPIIVIRDTGVRIITFVNITRVDVTILQMMINIVLQ